MKNLEKLWSELRLESGDYMYMNLTIALQNLTSTLEPELKAQIISLARRLKKMSEAAEKQQCLNLEGCPDNVLFRRGTLYIGYTLHWCLVKDNKINWAAILLRLSRIKTF